MTNSVLINIFKFISSDIAAKAISVLGIGVFAYFLTPAELGKFGEWFTYFNFLAIFMSLGLPSYVLLGYSKRDESLRCLFTTSLFLNFCMLFLALLYILFLARSLEYVNLLLVSFLYCVFLLLQSVFMVLKSLRRYFLLQVLYSCLMLVVPLSVMYITNSFNSGSRIIGFSLAVFLITCILIKPCVRLTAFSSLRKRKLVKALKFGLPLSLLACVGWVKQGVDIFILSKYVNYESTGRLFFCISSCWGYNYFGGVC